jgi:hypothetical protein
MTFTVKALKDAAAAAEVEYVLDDDGNALTIEGETADITIWISKDGYELTAYWMTGGYGWNPPEPMDKDIETLTDPAEAIERAVLHGRDDRP